VTPVCDAQVRKLMEEMNKHGAIGQAAMKAGMDRKTARKYVAAGKLPSEMQTPREWRTRPDPFEDD
jgi:molybdenum-dependent DNA-binding transcriptional regulator ModE